jgi:hypothetical protein
MLFFCHDHFLSASAPMPGRPHARLTPETALFCTQMEGIALAWAARAPHHH